MAFSPSFDRFGDGAGRELIRLGHPLVDGYLELVAARARWNTVLAQPYDLKVFFSIVDADPVDVVAADVLRFISAQRQPRVAGNVVRIEDGESGLSARTIKRRLATLAGLYDYLIVRGDVASSPLPKGLASRRGGQRAVRGVALIRAPRIEGDPVVSPAGSGLGASCHAPCSVRTSRHQVTRSLVSSENRGRPSMATAATAASGGLCQRRPRMVTEWAHRARMWRALPPLSALTSRCHRWILPKSVGLESGRILLAARRRSCSAVWCTMSSVC